MRFSNGKVEFKMARPKAGYQYKVWRNGPDDVVVSFTRDGHTSWVWASYRNGSPSSGVIECSGRSRDECRPAT